jgi:hypothetical protein
MIILAFSAFNTVCILEYAVQEKAMSEDGRTEGQAEMSFKRDM